MNFYTYSLIHFIIPLNTHRNINITSMSTYTSTNFPFRYQRSYQSRYINLILIGNSLVRIRIRRRRIIIIIRIINRGFNVPNGYLYLSIAIRGY